MEDDWPQEVIGCSYQRFSGPLLIHVLGEASNAKEMCKINDKQEQK